MRNIWGVKPLVRAVAVISLMVVMVSGVTYAALQSQTATLTGNSIQTASADLRIGTSTSTFDTTRTGFKFTNVVPGVVPGLSDGFSFYLKNYGSGNMLIKAAVSSVPANTSNADLSKVYLNIVRVDSSQAQKYSIAALMAAQATGGLSLPDTLGTGTYGSYKLQVIVDDDAFSSASALISGIDLVFNGVVVVAS